MRRRSPAPATFPAPVDPVPSPDPWVALLSPDPAPPLAPKAPSPPTEADALGIARADAARRLATRLVDRRGAPVRVLATLRRGDDLEVVLSAAAVPPPGWSARGEVLVVPAAVDTAALVAATPDALADPAPALLERAGAAVDVAAAGVVTVTHRAATVATVRSLLAGLLRAPGAPGLDVLVSGLDPRCLPASGPDSPGRLHAPIEVAALVPLARSLAGTDEPVVVVAPAGALGAAELAALAADRIGALLVGGAPTGEGWWVDVGPDGATTLGRAAAAGDQRRRSAPDSRSAASAAAS